MTIKESIIKSLDDIASLASPTEIFDHIIKNSYYTFGAKDPKKIMSTELSNLIVKGDSRIKRNKDVQGIYRYYLTKHEQLLAVNQPDTYSGKTKVRRNEYQEKDLHKILCSFLKTSETFSMTIYHEQSNTKDSNQKWVHPDMVGIQFSNLYSKASQTFLKAINKLDTFKISSYEIKKEINSDYELKKTFFQAVSNSSWANYGYLAAFEISDNLTEELERLNQSFGIGIIKLKANPYESKIIFPAKYRDLEFKTIDKLCKINNEFEKFIEQIEKLLTASEKYYNSTEDELVKMCDKHFINEEEIQTYCRDKNIPMEELSC